MRFNRLEDLRIKIFSAVAVFFATTLPFLSSYFRDLVEVMFSNTLFESAIIAVILVAAINKIRHPKEVTWNETFIHLFGGIVFFVLLFFIYFTFFSDLKDISIYNSKVSEAVYEEPYTTESTDSDGHTTTTRHSADYYILTTTGEMVDINEEAWRNYVALFGNKTEEKKHRISQTHYSRVKGEGDIWHSKATKDAPVSTSHYVINYIKASKQSLYHKNKDSNRYQKSLAKYPKLSDEGYGKIVFHRVVDKAGVPVLELDKKLSALSAHRGPVLQVNPVVYIVKNQDRGYVEALESYQKGFKKNDVVIVINLDDDNNIAWADVRALTEHNLFKVELASNISDIGKYDQRKIYQAIEAQLLFPAGNEHGYKRTPMENFSYLKSDISISIPWILFFVLLILVFNIFLSKTFKEKDVA